MEHVNVSKINDYYEMSDYEIREYRYKIYEMSDDGYK